MRLLICLMLILLPLTAAGAERRVITPSGPVSFDLPDVFAETAPQTGIARFHSKAGAAIEIFTAPRDADFSTSAGELFDAEPGNWSVSGHVLVGDWAKWWGANGERRADIYLLAGCGGQMAGIRVTQGQPTTIDAEALFNSVQYQPCA